jgi:hypothetical protein
MYQTAPHSFHIPVMGLAFTIDSPVKVARYGIASVVSIVEDGLIESMRRHYYPVLGETYIPITTDEPDYRAKRITDYLDLIHDIVSAQVKKMKKQAFETGAEIVQYFEMLPDTSRLKIMYRQMMNTADMVTRKKLEAAVRDQLVPGSIDVNIMTKLDKNNTDSKGNPVENGSDAVAALRGYANSKLQHSGVVFSAGLNPRLYNYLENCRQFDADSKGVFQKKIIVKVSDYRSALVQGKYLAKKGIWVSEFRIESGLNCGGHAFATEGMLMGPILEEFKQKKQELADAMFALYQPVVARRAGHMPTAAPVVNITAQGGIGTAEEDLFLRDYYHLNSTGWGSPFLLVPEATTVDDATLQLLEAAGEQDVVLSNNSPLGVRFHYLKQTSADLLKQKRISSGHPGSPCTEKHLVSNTEFTETPICTASYKYQRLKIAQLQLQQLPDAAYLVQLDAVLSKECLCVGLSNAAAEKYATSFVKGRKEVSICPGPNIVWFSRTVSLPTMVSHIYGRGNIISRAGRPHMFIAELQLYIKYLKEELLLAKTGDAKKQKYYHDFCQNLLNGIAYYRALPGLAAGAREAMLLALNAAEEELSLLFPEKTAAAGA